LPAPLDPVLLEAVAARILEALAAIEEAEEALAGGDHMGAEDRLRHARRLLGFPGEHYHRLPPGLRALYDAVTLRATATEYVLTTRLAADAGISGGLADPLAEREAAERLHEKSREATQAVEDVAFLYIQQARLNRGSPL